MKSVKVLFYTSFLILFLSPLVLAQDSIRPRRVYQRVYIDEKGKVLKTEQILPEDGVLYPTRDEVIVVPKNRVGRMKIKASKGSSPAGQAVRGTGNVAKGVAQIFSGGARTGFRVLKTPFHRRNKDRVIYERQEQ